MDDQVLVCVLYCRTHVEKELQPRSDVEPVRVAIPGERQTVHILHHQVRTPILGDSAIQEPRNVGVYQPCENLALGQETLM